MIVDHMKLLGDWLLEPAGSKHPHSMVPNMCFCPHQQQLCFWKVYCQANGIHMDKLRISQHRSGSRNMFSGFFTSEWEDISRPKKGIVGTLVASFFFGRDDDPKVVIIEFWILECLSFIYLCPKLGEFASNGYLKRVKIDINQWLLGYSVFLIQKQFLWYICFLVWCPTFSSRAAKHLPIPRSKTKDWPWLFHHRPCLFVFIKIWAGRLNMSIPKHLWIMYSCEW